MLVHLALKRNMLFRPSEDELEDDKSHNICNDVAAGKACCDDRILLPDSRFRRYDIA